MGRNDNGDVGGISEKKTKKKRKTKSRSSGPSSSFYLLIVFLVIWCSMQWLIWRVFEGKFKKDNASGGGTGGQQHQLLLQSPRYLEKEEKIGHERNDEKENTGSKVTTITNNKKQQQLSSPSSKSESRLIRMDDSTTTKKTKTNSVETETTTTTTTEDFYIVFSTDCSGYQHWQGILLYYSALRVKQQGTIVRIASGCSPEQQIAVSDEWEKIDPTQQKFLVHFAPSTALHSSYKYSNKPGGILHWLQNFHKLKPDTVVCLLDPDMILLKPITSNLVSSPDWSKRQHGRKQTEYVNKETGIAEFLRVKSLEEEEKDEPPNTNNNGLPSRVTTGYAAGQHFGVGGAWTQGMEVGARPVWQNFSKSYICGRDGACTTTTSKDAYQYYSVGPVYIATVTDWNSIAKTWWDYVPRVHEQYPHLLAEMYAFTMAVANIGLKFTLFSSYMITGSKVDSPTESWSWIDDIMMMMEEEEGKNTKNNNPQQQLLQQAGCPVGIDDDTFQAPPLADTTTTTSTKHHHPLPNVLHHCQPYKLEFSDENGSSSSKTFLFAKRKIPHDVFSCGSAGDDGDGNGKKKKKLKNPIPFDIQDLIQQVTTHSPKTTTPWSKTDRRTLFALCHAVSILNWARKLYQEQVCTTAATPTNVASDANR